jgi:hypothetical protein
VIQDCTSRGISERVKQSIDLLRHCGHRLVDSQRVG